MKKITKIYILLFLLVISLCGKSSALEPIVYSKTLKDLAAELNTICTDLGWHQYSEEDLKILIILGISKLDALSDDEYERARLLKLAKGIIQDGKIYIPIRMRQSIEDGCLYLPDTKDQIHFDTGKFTIVNLDILDTDKIVPGEKMDWQSIRVFVKAGAKIIEK